MSSTEQYLLVLLQVCGSVWFVASVLANILAVLLLGILLGVGYYLRNQIRRPPNVD